MSEGHCDTPPGSNPPDKSPATVFIYPGTMRQYVRQALGVTAAGALAGGALLFLLALVDRLMDNRGSLELEQAVAVIVLVSALGIFSLFLARSLSVFRIEVSSRGLRVFRLGGSLTVAYEEILSVEKVGLPPWWPFRADLLPWRESARRIIRIRRRGGPAVTFLSGLGEEKELLELIEGRLAARPP